MQEPDNFYLRWLYRTFSGPWGVSGLVGGLLSLFIPAIIRLVPDLREAGDEMNDLIWIVPLTIFGGLAIVRAVVVPAMMFREEAARAERAESELRRRLAPTLILLPAHASSHAGFIVEGGVHEVTLWYHRVVVTTSSVVPVADVRAFVVAIDGQSFTNSPIRLHRMYDDDGDVSTVTLFQNVPEAFDVIKYSEPDRRIWVLDSRHEEALQLGAAIKPVRLTVNVVGSGAPTLECYVTVFQEQERLRVEIAGLS